MRRGVFQAPLGILPLHRIWKHKVEIGGNVTYPFAKRFDFLDLYPALSIFFSCPYHTPFYVSVLLELFFEWFEGGSWRLQASAHWIKGMRSHVGSRSIIFHALLESVSNLLGTFGQVDGGGRCRV